MLPCPGAGTGATPLTVTDRSPPTVSTLQHCSTAARGQHLSAECHRAPVLARACRMIWHLVTLYCSSYGTEVGLQLQRDTDTSL